VLPVVAVQDSSSCPFAQPPSREAEPVQAVLVLGHSAPPALHAVSQFFCSQVLKGRPALAHAGSFPFWSQAEDAFAEQLRLPPGQTQVR
jgi:hypothetical protein